MKKKLIAVVVVLVVLAGLVFAGIRYKELEVYDIIPDNALVKKETLYFWYTDDALTDYLGNVALKFYEDTDVRVIPVLMSGLEYLEAVNDASLNEENYPDLYITSNDLLEKSFLAGLASDTGDDGRMVNRENYPQPAIDAVTYQGRTIGYPLYYETSALLYNKTYLQTLAETVMNQENGSGDEYLDYEELPMENTEDAETQADGAAAETQDPLPAEVEQKIDTLIPATMNDILTFANEYDAPEQVEAVFKWDVTDIFYNYWVIGNYMDIGGPAGDRSDRMDLYNEEAISCLQIYQDLNQFFYIDTREISYDSVIQEFIDGKIVFTIATSDAIAKIETAREEGTFSYEYGVTTIPELSGELTAKSLSVTNAVVINGYSRRKELAGRFAEYLCIDRAEDLYSRAGKVSARQNVSYENSNVSEFMKEYERSAPIPKMMATSNFWVQMEIAFSEIWKGAEVSGTLKTLAEQIMGQVSGGQVQLDYIEVPEEVRESQEYLDEEALRQEAQSE